MNKEKYLVAKSLYINEKKSLTKISKELGINRKELSCLFKKDGIVISKGNIATLEQELELIELYKDGCTINELLKRFKIDYNTCKEMLYKHGQIEKHVAKHNKYSYNEPIFKDIMKDYKEKALSIRELSRIYSISEFYIKDFLENEGYNIGNRKFNIDQSVFETIDSEEKAYWLGFLYADGYVYNQLNCYILSLSLKYEDKGHIYKFCEIIGETNIYDKDIKLNGKIYKSSRVDICSKKIVEDLIKLGCTQRKSLILKFPTLEQVPLHLQRHFIRGYIDGDGCVVSSVCNNNTAKTIVSVLGTYNFLFSLNEILVKECMLNNKTPKNDGHNGNAFCVSYGGNLQCKRIYEYLYKDATIYLERKEKKYNVCRLETSITEVSR